MTGPPKSIRIGPFDISVKPFEASEDRDKCLGLWSETRMTIYLRDQFASPQQEAETLLHEVLHAAFTVGNISDKDSEERTVSQLSLVLAQVIRDNDLFTWIKERLS